MLTSAWPDPGVCTRLLSTPVLAEPITRETRDLRFTRDPQLFSVLGHIEGRPLQFVWEGRGSSTRLTRLREWEKALGPDAIAAVRGSKDEGDAAAHEKKIASWANRERRRTF